MSTPTVDAPPVVLRLEKMYPNSILEDQIFANTGYIFHSGEMGLDDSIPESIAVQTRQRVQGLLIFRRFIRADDLDLFPNLKVVVRMGVGYDRLDRVAMNARGIKVCNTPDYGTTEVADHTIAIALSLRRGILLHHDLQRASPPAPWSAITTPLIQRPTGPTAPPTDIYTAPRPRTFGILGLGRIGTAVALRAKAFGWRVVFYDPYVANGVDRSVGIIRCKTIEDLFSQSDTLSLHVPLSHETRRIVNERLLRLMPSGGVLINTARGAVVHLDGLEAVLRDGHLAGAGLDVLPEEDETDITADTKVHPLIEAYRAKEEWLVGRLVITPHSAYHSKEAWDDIRSLSALTMKEVLVEGQNTNVIPANSE